MDTFAQINQESYEDSIRESGAGRFEVRFKRSSQGKRVMDYSDAVEAEERALQRLDSVEEFLNL